MDLPERDGSQQRPPRKMYLGQTIMIPHWKEALTTNNNISSSKCVHLSLDRLEPSLLCLCQLLQPVRCTHKVIKGEDRTAMYP